MHLPAQDGSAPTCYAGHTVLPIPAQEGADDDQLGRNVAKAVYDTVVSGNAYTEPERTAYIRNELKKLPSDPRFVQYMAAAS